VLEERVRIARELHDVLAHHVSVMGVQAGAARRVLLTQPDTATDLLSSIEASSRSAVVELQRLLGLLRQAGDVDAGGPQPNLDGLTELAEQVREAGLDVHLDLDAAEIPPAVALSAYRIVQEALTNTLKHAGTGHRADVQVRRRPSSLEVVVVDDGRGPAGEDTAGHGLVGMRERVLLHGGELKAGRRTGAPGFEVRAWFPL
jgi:signal transduction histidine kinase